MKTFFKFKHLLIAIVAIVAILSLSTGIAKAQVALINPNGFALDTCTQAANEGPVTPVVKGTAKTFNIVVYTLKISGTIAGTLQFQGSNDGTTFANIGSAVTLTDQAGVKGYTYSETDKKYLYYKALFLPTGTEAFSYKATYYVTLPTISNVNN
jgi:hypothetical protein